MLFYKTQYIILFYTLSLSSKGNLHKLNIISVIFTIQLYLRFIPGLITLYHVLNFKHFPIAKIIFYSLMYKILYVK